MQPQVNQRKRLIIITSLVIFVGLIALISILALRAPTNQFGKIIRIQNYDQKVKNLSPDMKDAMESYLYNIVKKNSKDSFDPSSVKDANIRDSSDTQSYNSSNDVYTGTFIIDITSIKQSYQTQYSYSSNESNTDVGGNPVVISCLPKDKLKYGEFNCIDFVSQQAGANDPILQYLPYQNFSYKITPDETQGTPLILNVTFTIPESDLKGDTASKQAVIASYIKQVSDWIVSKGDEPSNYRFVYNYDANGNRITAPQGHAED
jgi:hypothetical protein